MRTGFYALSLLVLAGCTPAKFSDVQPDTFDVNGTEFLVRAVEVSPGVYDILAHRKGYVPAVAYVAELIFDSAKAASLKARDLCGEPPENSIVTELPPGVMVRIECDAADHLNNPAPGNPANGNSASTPNRS